MSAKGRAARHPNWASKDAKQKRDSIAHEKEKKKDWLHVESESKVTPPP